MKKNAVCIFAHPDDESFGPSGTIHLLTKTHNVFIICATNGDAGENHHPTETGDLATIRKREISASSKILGVEDVFFLNYPDGELNNNKYHEIAADVQKILDDKRPDVILTFEHRGISGHVDHIIMSMISSYLYMKLSYVKKIMFWCFGPGQRNKIDDDYFIFFPPEYTSDQINYSNKITPEVEQVKIKAMRKHLSQAKDLERIIKYKLRDAEHFYVWEKDTTPKV